ncbi:hypothetical protein ABZP36_015043, partial [Zizania latifolia]
MHEAISRQLGDATTEQSSNDGSSVDEKLKPQQKIESMAVKTKTAVPKIVLDDHKWTDGNIPLNAVSDKLSKMGKGDCKWAQWLLFFRVKGYEYEASFSNALWNLSQEMVRHSNFIVIEMDEILYNVDDMVEQIGEMFALATLISSLQDSRNRAAGRRSAGPGGRRPASRLAVAKRL